MTRETARRRVADCAKDGFAFHKLPGRTGDIQVDMTPDTFEWFRHGREDAAALLAVADAAAEVADLFSGDGHGELCALGLNGDRCDCPRALIDALAALDAQP